LLFLRGSAALHGAAAVCRCSAPPKRPTARRFSVRTAIYWGLGAWFFAAAPILAQSPPSSTTDADVAAGVVSTSADADSYRYWVRGEYLAYLVKNAPLPVSVVTGDQANPTQELLNSNQSFGMFSGFRVGVGAWLDCGNSIGVEGDFFWLQQRSHVFTASSDATGNPTLAFPFVNQTPGAAGDTVMPITSPGIFAGGVAIASTLQLWGAEANGVFFLTRDQGFEFCALAGLRYVDLRETLNIGTVSGDMLTTPDTVLSTSDQFNTRNQFYGGQVGGRVSWQGEYVALDVTGKVAVGATHQTIDVQGVSTQSGPDGGNGVFPGGFFAQTSNSGNHGATQFGFIPSVEVKFSVFITPQLRAFVGYDFLYWSQVVRPGNQVDRNVNLSQSAVFGGGTLIGPAYPTVPFSRSDFWAQGLNLGLDFRF
jgi:hypothetical protein